MVKALKNTIGSFGFAIGLGEMFRVDWAGSGHFFDYYMIFSSLSCIYLGFLLLANPKEE